MIKNKISLNLISDHLGIKGNENANNFLVNIDDM